MDSIPSAEESNAALLALIAQAQVPRPKNVQPIMMIGAGGIVRDAHLPAYKKPASRSSAFSTNRGKGQKNSHLNKASNEPSARLPMLLLTHRPTPYLTSPFQHGQLISILTQLLDGSTVLMQKPM
jgi:hypothetical protein